MTVRPSPKVTGGAGAPTGPEIGDADTRESAGGETQLPAPAGEPSFKISLAPGAPSLTPQGARVQAQGIAPNGEVRFHAATFGPTPTAHPNELEQLLRDVPIPPDWQARLRAMVEYFRATPPAQRDRADLLRFLPPLVLDEPDLMALAPAELRAVPGFAEAMRDIVYEADPMQRRHKLDAVHTQPWFTPRAFELLQFLGDVFHVEAGAEVRRDWSKRDTTGEYHDAGASLDPRLRVRIDFNAARPYLPKIFPNTPHNALTLGGDLLLLNGVIFGLLSAGLAPDVLPNFRQHLHEQGLFGFHGFNWKDGNFGDAWSNPITHSLGFNLVATYLRQRGYSQWAALTGGMAMNFLWEFMWENYEGMSAHDFAFANLLGVVTGSFDRLGMAFGIDPTQPASASRRYTEFYYRTDGGKRYFLRTMPTAVTVDEAYAQRPLMAYDFAVGMSNEQSGLTLWVSAEASPTPKSGADVHGMQQLFSGVGFGVSLDVRALGHQLFR